VIEEKAWIVRTEANLAWVETQRKTACDSCSVRTGCGTGTLAKLLGRKSAPLQVLNPLAVGVGEEVVVGIREASLVRGSLMVYVVPLLAMFGFGLVGKALGVSYGLVDSEGMTIVAAVFGLGLGFGWVRRFGNRIGTDQRYQAVILRRVQGAGRGEATQASDVHTPVGV